MIQPWREVRSKVLMERFGKEVRETVFLNPVTNLEEEFLLFGQADSAVVLSVTDQGEVVTVLEYKQGCNKIIRELPGGGADFAKESPEETVKRELLEETGYKAETLVFLGPPVFITPRNSWSCFYIFLALGCVKIAEPKRDPSEEIEVELIPVKKWMEMAPGMESPAAIVATFRSLSYLSRYL